MFSPMGSIGRYMFRATMGAFLITLVSLTVVIWFTQAMRDFDLITSQRQTLLVFVGSSWRQRMCSTSSVRIPKLS